MSELHLPLIDKLAERLVTPERFGKLAVEGFATEEDQRHSAMGQVAMEFPDLPSHRVVYGWGNIG